MLTEQNKQQIKAFFTGGSPLLGVLTTSSKLKENRHGYALFVTKHQLYKSRLKRGKQNLICKV